jgi:hypothetical protein
MLSKEQAITASVFHEDHEIQVMVQGDDGAMVLIDRCTLEAEDTRMSAAAYAKLFGEGKVAALVANLSDTDFAGRDDDDLRREERAADAGS